MTQHSEDRIEDAARPPPASAQVIPFERPQSDLQRAVQQRAQEAIERERERGRTRPAPLRWLLIAVVAAVPVALLFGAVDRFLHVFYKMNETLQSAPAPTAPMQPQPEPFTSSEAGVVILQPIEPAPSTQ